MRAALRSTRPARDRWRGRRPRNGPTRVPAADILPRPWVHLIRELDMARSIRLLLGALLLVAGAREVGAQAPRDDEAAVLAAVQRLFDAMASRDTAAARALMVRGTQFVSVRSDTTGVA